MTKFRPFPRTLSTLSALSALSATLALQAAPAAADPQAGWYATAIGGVTSQGSQDFSLAGAAEPAATARFDPGFLAGAAVGYQFEGPWQLEAEFTYQTVDVDRLRPEAFGPFDEGNYASTAFAANARYSADLFGSPRARAFLGAGVVWLTEVDIDFEQAGNERSFSGDGFGLQLLAGARYEVGERLFLEAAVRYLRATSLDLRGEGGETARLEGDYAPLSATLALGYRF